MVSTLRMLGKSNRVGCHVLLQGNFPTWGSNPGLPHCRQTLHPLSHQGSPFHSNSHQWNQTVCGLWWLNFIISAPNTGRWHVLFTIRVFTPFFILCYEVYHPWVNLIFGHIQNSEMNKSEANCTLRGGPAIQSQGLFPHNNGGLLTLGVTTLKWAVHLTVACFAIFLSSPGLPLWLSW